MLGYKNKAEAAPNVYGAANAKTVIGAETEIEGIIRLSESLLIQGTVRGDMVGNKDITVGTQGLVTGNITCQNLTIAGKVIGNVKIEGTLHITAKGNLMGDAETNSLLVDEMGLFNGTCIMVQQEEMPKLIPLKESGRPWEAREKERVVHD